MGWVGGSGGGDRFADVAEKVRWRRASWSTGSENGGGVQLQKRGVADG